MKVFVKYEGAVWTTYYAIDQEANSVSSIEVRFSDSSRSYIDSYIVSSYSADRGNFDRLATEILMTYDKITEKQWKEAKKEVADYIKHAEALA